MFIRWDKYKKGIFYLKFASSYREGGKVKQAIIYLGRARFDKGKINFDDKVRINDKLKDIFNRLQIPLELLEQVFLTGRENKLRITSYDKKRHKRYFNYSKIKEKYLKKHKI